MEAIEEHPVHSVVDSAKVNVISDENNADSLEVEVCHQSNGVSDSADAEHSLPGEAATVPGAHDFIPAVAETESDFADRNVIEAPIAPEAPAPMLASDAELMAVMSETASAVEHLLGDNSTKSPEEISEQIIESHVEVISHGEEVTLEETTIELENVINDKVTFKTEVMVEKNDIVDPVHTAVDVHDNTNNLLKDLEQGIELSEVLCSSETADNVENNNCTIRQQVFNKEELLDILEGNDEILTANQNIVSLQSDDSNAKKILEAQIAMNQLSRLRKSRSKRKVRSVDKQTVNIEKTPRKKKIEKKSADINTEAENTNSVKDSSLEENKSMDNVESETEENISGLEKKINDSIVNVLAKDWDDDEPETNQTDQLLQESENLIKTCDELEKSLETVTTKPPDTGISTDATTQEGQSANESKSGDEPQRRLGRVIKKKVIFDPDNPDTFTKGKILKNKEAHPEKEQPLPKKIKPEPTTPRSKSKSPLSKMQWKKPTPKNSSKQNRKKLSEVDKLLMDEGAVNMIYQLTPEAPKGRKNIRNKAEFIKKIQSSTPDGKEMKFRERKKEIKLEEGEARRILGGKQRSSLSSSVKSPMPSDDFETHSADDSIIYRRHSSSSYSSTCMSPRRLSDVDPSAVQNAARALQQASDSINQSLESENTEQVENVFMPDYVSSNEIINKDDCLSIKKKLNTKLSLALNKRKRDSTKGDKPAKQKKLPKTEEHIESSKSEKINSNNYLSIKFDQRLAEICIEKTGSGVEILMELQKALVSVDNNKDISVTLLTSQCGTLCSNLDLGLLLDDNMQKRTNYAYEIAESVRLLLCAMEQHSKLLVMGVWGPCADLDLALVALSDVALASECATFGLSTTPPMPGAAVFTMRRQSLPPHMINDLVVFGRRLSASEALQNGLVTRSLWPERIGEQVRAIARDIAAQSLQSVLLKKQLLNMKKMGDSETFLLCLEKERDLLVEYWTSMEGQEAIRATLDTI